MAKYKKATIMLNLGIHDNYSFVCPTAQLVLKLTKPIGTIRTLSESVIVGLKHGFLLDLDNVVDIEKKCFLDIPTDPVADRVLTGGNLDKAKLAIDAKAMNERAAATKAEQDKVNAIAKIELDKANEVAKAKLAEIAKSKVLGKKEEVVAEQVTTKKATVKTTK
jgi:hypothetical protein